LVHYPKHYEGLPLCRDYLKHESNRWLVYVSLLIVRFKGSIVTEWQIDLRTRRPRNQPKPI